jgi:hypothetical protein
MKVMSPARVVFAAIATRNAATLSVVSTPRVFFLAALVAAVLAAVFLRGLKQRNPARDSSTPGRTPLPPLTSANGMNATCEVHFRDSRPPHEIQFALERALTLLLSPTVEGDTLVFRAASKVNGAPHEFTLRFEAALPAHNAYSFRAAVSLDGVAAADRDSRAKSLASWFGVWTGGFGPAEATPPGASSRDHYRALTGRALNAEAHLTTVATVQQAILAGLRAGATYSTAHKEGGTVIRYSWGHFQRADFGESSDSERFISEAAFLAFLRKFYDWETSRHIYPEKVPELVAWKLMLRLLQPKP